MWSPVICPPPPALNSPSALNEGSGSKSTSGMNIVIPDFVRKSCRWILVLTGGCGSKGTLRPNFTSRTVVGLKMWFQRSHHVIDVEPAQLAEIRVPAGLILADALPAPADGQHVLAAEVVIAADLDGIAVVANSPVC